MRARAAVALVVVVLLVLAACNQKPKVANTDNPLCGAYGYPASLRGSLHGQEAAARAHAGQARKKDRVHMEQKARAHPHDSAVDSIIPLCNNHAFSENELARGRFVAIIVVHGATDPRFSRLDDDSLAWWMFDDGGTPQQRNWRSQYISLVNGTVYDAPAIPCTSSRPTTELVAWVDEKTDLCGYYHGTGEADARHDSAIAGTLSIPRTSHTPWFGCALGCCYGGKIQ